MILFFVAQVENDDTSRCFFHFFKILFFLVFRRQKGKKWQKILSHAISQELYLMWLWFLVHICKMISPAFFFIFFKILIFSFFSKFINKSHLLKMCVIFVILYHFFSSRKDLASHLHLQKGLAFFCFVVFNSSGN